MKRLKIFLLTGFILMILLSCFKTSKHETLTVTAEECRKYHKAPVSFKVKVPVEWDIYTMASEEIAIDNYLELVRYIGEDKQLMTKAVSFGYFTGGNKSNKNLTINLAEQLIASMKTQANFEDEIYQKNFISLRNCEAYSVVMKFKNDPANLALFNLEDGEYLFWIVFLFNPVGENGLLVLCIDRIQDKNYKLPNYIKKTHSYKIVNSVKFLKGEK